MTIAIRSIGAALVGAQGSTETNYIHNVSTPPGAQPGDYLVMAYRSQTSAGNASDPTSSGWSLLTTPRATLIASGRSSSEVRCNSLVGRFAPSSIPSTYPFQVLNHHSSRYVAVMLALTGVDPTTPFDSATQRFGGGSVEAWSTPINKFLLELYGAELTASNDHALGSYSGLLAKQIDFVSPASGSLSVSRTVLRVHSGYAGSSGHPQHTNATVGNPASPSVWQVALNEAPEVQPEPVGLEVDYIRPDGQTVKANLSVYDGVSEKPVSAIGYMPVGEYPSVTEMYQTDEFRMAHRGGSADWPEMTMRAYTNAVAWGASLLEVSCYRTIDGVWVGSHDSTTARIFTNHPSVDIRDVTWASLADYRTTNGNHPLERLVDILDLYGDTHLFMLDNKAGSFQTEWLDLLDANGGPERIINKSWAPSAGNRALAAAAGLRGYRSWGFYYEPELVNLSATHGPWTSIGLEYSASQAAWDQLVNIGKPVIAHIMPTAATVQTAKTKILQAMANTGKTVNYGYQISGVKSAIPQRLSSQVSGL